jgi:hypothetical protein
MRVLDVGAGVGVAGLCVLARVPGTELTATNEWNLTPDLPAVGESLSGFQMPAWRSMMGPAGLSAEVVQALNRAVARGLEAPDVRERGSGDGDRPVGQDRAQQRPGRLRRDEHQRATGREERGQILQQHPTWRIEIAPDAEANERGGTATERAKSISDYLNSKWEVTTDRITSGLPIGKQRIATLTLTSEAKK